MAFAGLCLVCMTVFAWREQPDQVPIRIAGTAAPWKKTGGLGGGGLLKFPRGRPLLELRSHPAPSLSPKVAGEADIPAWPLQRHFQMAVTGRLIRSIKQTYLSNSTILKCVIINV